MTDELHSSKRHLSDERLVRLQDGELPSKEAEMARTHLEACWSCRHRAERLSYVVMRVVEYWNAVSDQFPLRTGGRGILQEKLRAQASEIRKRKFGRWPRWQSFSRVLQPRIATSLIAGLGILYWLFSGAAAPVAEAGDVLARAGRDRESALQRFTYPVIHQKLELSHGVERVEYELWHAPLEKRQRRNWSHASRIASDVRAIYRANGLDETDLLSSEAFTRLRDRLPSKTEKVALLSDGKELAIVTSDPKARGTGSIREATLLVRAADFHPIGQTIRAVQPGAEAEYRIREISYAVLPFDRVPTGIFEAPPAPVVPAHPPSRTPSAAESQPALPISRQLMESEAKLRVALHRLGFDRHLSPRIRPEASRVVVQIVVEDSAQKEQLLAAVKDIPFVDPQIWDPDGNDPGATPLSEVVVGQESSYRTDPPLNQALREYFGTLDLTNSYIGNVHKTFRAAIMEALALRRLAERYPNGEFQQLSAESQQALNEVAASHVDLMRDHWPQLAGLLDPVLSHMEAQLGVTAVASRSMTDPCKSWRETAPSIAGKFRELESVFNQMFVLQQKPVAAPAGAAESLRRAITLRNDLDREVIQLCIP